MKKIRVALIFGGRSEEHEVSIKSARNIYEALDKEKYLVTLFGIDRNGTWLPSLTPQKLFSDNSLNKISFISSTDALMRPLKEEKRIEIIPNFSNEEIDVVFPVLHGPYGEDGTIQGFLKLANVPFVGSDVLGSAIGMDKDVSKRLLREAGIPVAKFLVFKSNEKIDFEKVNAFLGLPIFVKPANLGSSVGVSKVSNKKDFDIAVKKAFKFDKKILVEEGIVGRELECSVLGNDEPVASVVGEVMTKGHEFYDYEAKYIDENGSEIIIPAKIPPTKQQEIKDLAIKIFKVLCCEGMARVDLFLTKNGKIIVNEINTIPGFTNISMYPKLWEASGLSYPMLIDKLIELAIEKHKSEASIDSKNLI